MAKNRYVQITEEAITINPLQDKVPTLEANGHYWLNLVP